MQQLKGTAIALACRTQVQGVPGAEVDGTALASFVRVHAKSYPKRAWIEVVIAGAGTCNLTLYVRDVAGVSGVWGIPVDVNGNMGLLANGANLSAGTYFFIFEDIMHCGEACLVQSGNAGGTPTTTATIAAFIERSESV